MHDEFRASLARQGISEEAYLKAVEKASDDLHADFRPNAEKRAKTLLVLSKVSDAEGVEVRDAEVDAEVAQGHERYGDDQRLISYFESERGRSFIRSTLRRSRVVERLIDEWLAAHPTTRRCRTSRTWPARPSAPRVPRRTPPSAPPTRVPCSTTATVRSSMNRPPRAD